MPERVSVAVTTCVRVPLAVGAAGGVTVGAVVGVGDVGVVAPVCGIVRTWPLRMK